MTSMATITNVKTRIDEINCTLCKLAAAMGFFGEEEYKLFAYIMGQLRGIEEELERDK